MVIKPDKDDDEEEDEDAESDDDDTDDGEAENRRRGSRAPSGVEEVTKEGETVNPGAAGASGALRAQLAFPPHRMTRRAAIIVVALVVAALVGVVLMVVPASPLHKKPTLGLDLQGGLEITKQAVPPKGHKLTKEDLSRSVSIMRDRVDRLGVSEPEIRRRARPDHDPAAGRQGSRSRREDHRQDGAARALRPRDEPRAAVDRHQRLPGRQRLRLRPARGPAGDRQGQVRPVVALQQEEEARRRPGRDEEGRARASSTARCPTATSSSPCPAGPWSISCGVGESSARASARPDGELLLPLQVRRRRPCRR